MKAKDFTEQQNSPNASMMKLCPGRDKFALCFSRICMSVCAHVGRAASMQNSCTIYIAGILGTFMQGIMVNTMTVEIVENDNR